MDASPGLIHAAIVGIMSQAPTVAKGRTNTQQNYKFRGIDDLYQTLQPLLAHHAVHVYPHQVLEDTMVERPNAKGTGVVIHVRQRVEFRFTHARDGSYVSVVTTGEAMDHGGDKASNKAMSAAMKYALIQVFLIPTGEDIDTENYSPEAGSRRPSRPQRPQRPPPGEPQAPPPPDEGERPALVPVMARTEGGMWAAIGEEPRLRSTQQARLKILQKELGVEPGPWREKLFDWCGKSSSAELSEREADEWTTRLERSKAARAKRAAEAPT